jgi:gliding motility-associated-like protein
VPIAGVMNGFSTSPAQCSFTVEVSGPGADIIGVDVSAGPDVSIGEGESTQLQGFGGPVLDWSPTAGLSGNGIPDPIAAPVSTTRYTLTTAIAGCTFQDDVVVEVLRLIEPPNTFTPNGDGYNDTWDIPEINDYPGAEVTIHDRWGQVVLRSTGYREPWDGTNNGRALSVGTYYYHIQLNQLEGRSPPYTGFVTIVR